MQTVTWDIGNNHIPDYDIIKVKSFKTPQMSEILSSTKSFKAKSGAIEFTGNIASMNYTAQYTP